MDIAVDTDFFGYETEIYDLINDQISAVRRRRNGNRTYLPEYSTKIADSFLILNAIKHKMDGDYTLSVDKNGCRVTVTIGKAKWQSEPAENMEEAICDVALQIAHHPLYTERLYPLIEDKTDVPLAPVTQTGSTPEADIKRAWYDAR